MILVITGSRSIKDYRQVAFGIETTLLSRGYSADDVACLYSGGAEGVDKLAESWARKNWIPVRQFIPEWNKLGKRAGIVRNEKMADVATWNWSALVAGIYDGKSRGTRHMLEYSRTIGLDHFIYFVEPPNCIHNEDDE